MSYACESCGLQLRIAKVTRGLTGDRVTYEDCPRCGLYNAGVEAANAAALRIARDKLGSAATGAWLNEYGIFAVVGDVSGVIVGTPEEAAPFVELTTACLKVKEFHRVSQPKESHRG